MTRSERVVIRAVRNRWTVARVELHIPMYEACFAVDSLIATGELDRGQNGWLYLKGTAPAPCEPVTQTLTWWQRLTWRLFK